MAADLDTRLGLEWEGVALTAVPDVQRIVENAAHDVASRRALLVEVEDVRLSCAELRADLAANDTTARLATSRWTVRQVIAHLASWATRTRVELESFRDGTTGLDEIHFEPEGGPVVWNQREVERREGRGVNSLFDELDADWSTIAELIAGAPAALLRRTVDLPRTSGSPRVPWRMPIAAMIIGSCWHTRYHLSQLLRR